MRHYGPGFTDEETRRGVRAKDKPQRAIRTQRRRQREARREAEQRTTTQHEVTRS